MNNNRSIVNAAEFENEIQDMSDRQLSEFTAREVYKISATSTKHGQRITALEGRDRKHFGLAGGIGTAIGAGVIAVVNYFKG